MKKILLVSLYPEAFSNQLALWYLKAYLLKYIQKPRSLNISILVFPLFQETEIIIKKIYYQKPDIIGFSCYVWNIEAILKLSNLIKKSMPRVKVILGGPEASARPKELLKKNHSLDVVVKGEGEEVFRELVECSLFGDGDICGIKGISYRNKGRVIENAARPEIKYLDTLPSPYIEGAADIDTDAEIPIETSRGCVYKCHYCYYHKGFEGIRYFSLQRVKEELKYILKKRPTCVYLMDATFNVNKNRAKEILRIFIRYNKKTHLHVELRAELLDKEMVDLLYKAKSNFIEIGLQSTNKKTLRLINRPFKPVSFKKNILLLNKKKIPYELQLIDGLPGDNYKALKESLDWLFMLKPVSIKIMRFMLLPGTYLRQHAKELGIKYNPRPPYHSKESNTFSFEDINKTEVLRAAMGTCYGEGLLRDSLYLINKKLGIKFSDIFEEWEKWCRKEHNGIMRITKGNSGENKKMRYLMESMAVRKIAHLSIDFVEFLYKKYNAPFMDNKLLQSVQRDRRVFLRNQSIIEKKV